MSTEKQAKKIVLIANQLTKKIDQMEILLNKVIQETKELSAYIDSIDLSDIQKNVDAYEKERLSEIWYV